MGCLGLELTARRGSTGATPADEAFCTYRCAGKESERRRPRRKGCQNIVCRCPLFRNMGCCQALDCCRQSNGHWLRKVTDSLVTGPCLHMLLLQGAFSSCPVRIISSRLDLCLSSLLLPSAHPPIHPTFHLFAETGLIRSSRKGGEDDFVAAIQQGGGSCSGTSLNRSGASSNKGAEQGGHGRQQHQQQQPGSPKPSAAPLSPREMVVAAHSAAGGSGSPRAAAAAGQVPSKCDGVGETDGHASPTAWSRRDNRGHLGWRGVGGGGGSGRGDGLCAETRLRMPPSSSPRVAASATSVPVQLLTLDTPTSLPAVVSRQDFNLIIRNFRAV